MTTTIRPELRWLMDRAAEWGVNVRLVLPETVDQVAQWNAPCPRWRSRDVFAALHELERLGWIRFLVIDADGNEIPATRPTFDHQALIDAYTSSKLPLLYRLTNAGGVAWEEAIKPNWVLRYLVEFCDAKSPEEEGECIVTATNEEIARKAFLLTACSQNLVVVPGTERYVPCGRWKATYWKDLEWGVQAIAATGSAEPEFRTESQLPLASQQRCAESQRLLNRWYSPADEPKWQRCEYLNYGGMWD